MATPMTDPVAPVPPSLHVPGGAWSAVATAFPVAIACVFMGATLGGSAVGVIVASHRPPARMAPVVRASERTGAPLVTAPPETDPESAGDGVMDDLDDGPIAVAPPVPLAPPPLAARGARRGGHMVTSDNVPEGPVTGYVESRAVRIVVTRVDEKPVEVHTASAYRQMREAAQHGGVALRIVSGFRTMEHQQALYRAYRQGRGNLAAQPGTSNHQSGHALDLNTSAPGVFRWLQRNAQRFGFRRTVPTEPWHWEWW